ncbi:DUF4232 domain-containing protein [Pseudonocardia phyllosphaerae]|uniref:DUF4232 domain-containing protein n=1 Tax=Pseudonocardia phyllosphaerae TaxID=3390502 RepID=UPI00397BA788
MDREKSTNNRRTARWMSGILAGGTVLTALVAGGSAASASEPAAAAGAERCHTSELAASATYTDSGAGSAFGTVNLTNTGGRTCYIKGFPGLSFVAGDDGHQVGSPATMIGDQGDPIAIAPGQAAHAEFATSNVDAYDAATCKPVPVRGFRVYPPGETASLFAPYETRGCSAPGVGQPSVKAFRAP